MWEKRTEFWHGADAVADENNDKKPARMFVAQKENGVKIKNYMKEKINK